MNKILWMTILLWSAFSYGQKIEGIAIDSITREPIPFAKVFLVELNVGTKTNIEGKFIIQGNFPSKVLARVSATGYKSIDIQIERNSSVILVLEEHHVDLKEVTIYGESNKLESQGVINVEVRSVKELELTGSSSIGELMEGIPGVSNAGTGIGVSKPVIRGQQGMRIVTLLDGLRIENQQWGGDHGLGLTSLGIDQFEVLKGPASLAYGSDALGGVLYFKENSFANQHTHLLQFSTQYNSNTHGANSSLFYQGAGKAVKWNIGASHNEQADYQLTNNMFVTNSRFKEDNIKASIGWNKNKWVGTLRYNYLKANYGIIGHEHEEEGVIEEENHEDEFVSNVQERSLEVPYQEITNHFVSFNSKFLFKKWTLQQLIGFTSNNLKEIEEVDVSPALNILLNAIPYTFRFKRDIGKFALNAGVQGIVQFQSNSDYSEERILPNAQLLDNGVFVIGSYKFNETSSLLFGARADIRNVSAEEDSIIGNEVFSKQYNAVNFSVGYGWQRKENALKLNVSSGTRMPHMSELFANGAHHGALRYEVGEITLKKEFAVQADLNYEIQKEHVSFVVNPFANHISNYIFLDQQDTLIDDLPVYKYKNIASALLYGVDAGFHYHPHFAHILHWESNYSLVLGQGTNGEYLPFIPQPKLSTVLRFEFDMNTLFTIQKVVLEHNYYFRQDRVYNFETPSVDYHLINASIEMGLSKAEWLKLVVGMRNILNQNYTNHLSRLKYIGISNPGRNVFVKLNIDLEFNKNK